MLRNQWRALEMAWHRRAHAGIKGSAGFLPHGNVEGGADFSARNEISALRALLAGPSIGASRVGATLTGIFNIGMKCPSSCPALKRAVCQK